MPPSKKTTADNKYAATAWSTEQFSDLTCPSGQLCQVRRPGAEGLMRLGLLDQTKGLTALVDQKHLKRVKGQSEINTTALARDLVKDPAEALKIMGTIDKIVKYVVVQPELQLPFKTSPDGQDVPLLDNERVQGTIYTDMIEMEDRLFIFHYAVGGSSDLERFRSEFGESLTGLQNGGNISLPSV